MPKSVFFDLLQQEVRRVDEAKVAKRQEKVIEGFTQDPAPRALINGQAYRIFNSNDYLGLRHHSELKKAEEEASLQFGSGPGAVRFISGSLKVHVDLEKAIAQFHNRPAAMVFSSAFATNMAVLFSLIKGQSKDSVVPDNALVVSDELNHRSIIDGIRVANLPSEQRAVFKHMDAQDLARVLQENLGKYQRAVVVTDGVFSMLGEYQDLKKLRQVIDEFDTQYPQGILLVVDDAHGVGAFGQTGRGTEEVSGGLADVLVGTFGKALGSDGGYVVADQVVIDYLRESAATYIYSNSISPATAGAALKAVELIQGEIGAQLLSQLRENVTYFKNKMIQAGFTFAADSIHPIQAILIADPVQTMDFKTKLFEQGMLVTNINYPVVPKGKDEIRVQISAAHTQEDLDEFIRIATATAQQIGFVKV